MGKGGKYIFVVYIYLDTLQEYVALEQATTQNPLALAEADLKMMLAANTHIGQKKSTPHVMRYVWRRRINDGVYIINLGMTWEKILLAARVIVAIENAEDVVAISSRQFGQRAVFKFAQQIGCSYIGGRYTPGTFSNYTTRTFTEPRLLIVTDPRADYQAVKEATYVNVPIVALVDTDTPMNNIDLAIPCNNKAKHSIALVYWLLAREVLRMRLSIPRDQPWKIVVDLFMHRDVDAPVKKEESEAVQEIDEPQKFGIEQSGFASSSSTWSAAAPAASWDESAGPPAASSWNEEEPETEN